MRTEHNAEQLQYIGIVVLSQKTETGDPSLRVLSVHVFVERGVLNQV